MWVLTAAGFFSAVEHRDDPDVLIVRARHRDDILALCAALGSEPVEGGGTDYEFRTVVGKEPFAKWLRTQAREIDYPNFKDAVAERQGVARANLYGDVWLTLTSLAQLPERRADAKRREDVVTSPGKAAPGAPEIYFDRRVPSALIDALTPAGPFSDLVPAVGGSAAPLDLHVRARDNEPQRPVERRPAHATLYLGLTRILDLHYDGKGRFRLTGHPTSKTFKGVHDALFDEAWSRWQPLEHLDGASQGARDRYAEAIIARASGNGGRYVGKEGLLQARLSNFPNEFVVIDREAVVGYRDNAAKARHLRRAREPVERAIEQLRRSGKAWTRTAAASLEQREAGKPQHAHLLGNELDAIAIDPEGRVLAIEAKHGSDTGGVGWTPAQVAVYMRLLQGWIDNDPARARTVLTAMFDQRRRLGVIGDQPRALREPLEIIPVIAVSSVANPRVANTRMTAVTDALHDAGIDMSQLRVLQVDDDGGLDESELGGLT